MGESNGVALIDAPKVQAVIALCEDLRALSQDDPQFIIVQRRLDEQWRSLSPLEQDEVDRIFGKRGLVRDK